MPFMERKASIKFVAIDKILVTTSFKQKTFQIKEFDMIDLVGLKAIPAAGPARMNKCPDFFACFEKDELDDNWIVNVFSSKDGEDLNFINCVTLSDKEKLVKTKVWFD